MAMVSQFWNAFGELPWQHQLFFVLALVVAFAFEFINGFHDTANAVTTVIYTKTLKPTPAVLFSGFCNFIGVLLGGTAVAFAIVNLLPVDLLIESKASASIVMVMSLLLAGVIWNLGTWWMGLPVSSSHTLIGSIMGVGMANSLMSKGNLQGVSWSKAADVGMSLLISPIIGFIVAGCLLLVMKRFLRDPRLYIPPGQGENPPRWIRGVLLVTCGGVSFAHGSNDGQKGMGLILLVLIGFMPGYYALNIHHPGLAGELRSSTMTVHKTLQDATAQESQTLRTEIESIEKLLAGKDELTDVSSGDRWQLRQAVYRVKNELKDTALPNSAKAGLAKEINTLNRSIEYVPFWVIVGVALALGIGTTIGYKRIVLTVAEKIGKTHLTYAQGAAAETIAALTIIAADELHLPVSTTQVLSSGIAGTMWANNSGVQGGTLKKIILAWILTLPASMLIAALFFTLGNFLF
ncbi:MAG: inorganic phosphate transporter [Saprospiraceae bacterium]